MKILLLKEFVIHFLPRLIGTPIHDWATYSKKPHYQETCDEDVKCKSHEKNVFQYDNGNFMISPKKKSHDSRGIFKHPQDSKTIELKERIIMFNYNNHKVVANFLKGFSYNIMG